MKSQLLEDIGENTTSPAPAGKPGQSKAGNRAQSTAASTLPAGARAAAGMGERIPAGKPPVPGTAQPGEDAPDELNKVFEEIAALEAQFVPPGQQQDLAMALTEPGQPLAGLPDGMTLPPAAAGPLAGPTPRAAAPQEPLFDFTPPAPPAPMQETADPFTPTWPQRSRRGYLPWVAGMLACVLLVLGGRWFYQERNVAGSLALIAADAKDRGGIARTEPAALSAKEATPEPRGEARVPPAAPASRPVSAPPPMVLLEPANAAGAGEANAAADEVESPAPRVSPEPAPVARRAAEPEPAKPSRQAARSRSDQESRSSRTRHEPVRPLASASTTRKPDTPVRDTSLAATLRACRELGYHATECVKRGCSITQYGLVCRGR